MTPDWPHTRAQIVDAFDGELPGANLEAAIVDIYEDNPTAVINAINAVATSLKAGKINSGWAVLKAASAKKATQRANPTISKERAIANAKAWIHNSGLMYDRWPEVEDELFGDQGRLKQWRTTKVRDTMHALWTELRPEGEAVEAAELERAAKWIADQKTIAAKPQAQAAAA